MFQFFGFIFRESESLLCIHAGVCVCRDICIHTCIYSCAASCI